jgi:hypothetical protein
MLFASGWTKRSVTLALGLVTLALADSTAGQVRIEVDPVVEQTLRIRATGETLPNFPVAHPSEIACAVGGTCSVRETLRVSVVNERREPLTYRSSCSPIQRVWEGGWVGIWPPRGPSADPTQRYGCAGPGIEQEITPGARISVHLSIHLPPFYDWRSANEDLRVVLDLRDSSGPLPVEMRTSPLFRVRDR